MKVRVFAHLFDVCWRARLEQEKDNVVARYFYRPDVCHNAFVAHRLRGALRELVRGTLHLSPIQVRPEALHQERRVRQ